MEISLAQNMAPRVLSDSLISPRRLKRSIEVIKEFFSEHWLQEIMEYYIEKEEGILKTHPIYSGLLKEEVSIKTPIVIEIATCLNRLSGKTNLASIVNDMKNPETFSDYFYHLSMGYRLSFIDEKVELEPTIEGKTPDNAFSFLGIPCIMECTVMGSSGTYDRFHDGMENLCNLVFSQAQDNNFPCSVQIEVNDIAIIQNIEQVGQEICKMFSEGKIPNTKDMGFCKINFLSPNSTPNGELRMRLSFVPEKEFYEAVSGGKPPISKEYSAQFGVSYSPISNIMHKDLEQRIYEKITSKIKQVMPLVGKYHIFLFIETDVSNRQLREKNDEIENEIVNNIMQSKVRNNPFSAIVLTNRPRGELKLFAINRAVYWNDKKLTSEWWGKFWEGFMSPALYHMKIPKSVDRNDPCACGFGLKLKHCHGYFL